MKISVSFYCATPCYCGIWPCVLLSVRPSVCQSVTRRISVKTSKLIIAQLTANDSPGFHELQFSVAKDLCETPVGSPTREGAPSTNMVQDKYTQFL